MSGISAPCAQERADGGTVAMASEFRLGILRHDPWSSAPGIQNNGKLAIHAQVLMPLPFVDAASAFMPRAQIGATLNLAGRTSHAFAGLAWTFDLTETLFAEAALGGAITGATRAAHAVQARNDMGCKGQFREAASLGYRISAQWSVITTIEHLSNAGLCARNRGMTNMGAMLGYRF